MANIQIVKVNNAHGDRTEFVIPAAHGTRFCKECKRLGLHVTDVFEGTLTSDFAEPLKEFAAGHGNP